MPLYTIIITVDFVMLFKISVDPELKSKLPNLLTNDC